MKARMPRARWWRCLLDWLQWYGPAWLVRFVPDWGITWELIDVDAKSIIVAR